VSVPAGVVLHGEPASASLSPWGVRVVRLSPATRPA
jgi:hypothetical protein